MDYQFSSSTVNEVGTTIVNTDTENISDTVSSIMGLAETIQAGWTGSDADAYVNALLAYKSDMDKLVQSGKTIGNTLIQIAKIMQEREEARRRAAESDLAS